MKKLLSRTHSRECSPSHVVFSPGKTDSSEKGLRSPKIENVDADKKKLANGHGGQGENKGGEGEQKQKFVRLRDWNTEKQVTDTLHQQQSRVSIRSHLSSVSLVEPGRLVSPSTAMATLYPPK